MAAKLYRRYRWGDFRWPVSLQRAIQADQINPHPQKADVNDRPFLAIVIALFALLAVASWQFYSLMAN